MLNISWFCLADYIIILEGKGTGKREIGMFYQKEGHAVGKIAHSKSVHGHDPAGGMQCFELVLNGQLCYFLLRKINILRRVIQI